MLHPTLFAGITCTCGNCESWIGWHPNEKQAPACAVCHSFGSTVCEEPLSLCFKWTPGRSFLSIWNGREGYCDCGWPWPLHRQRNCWVCLQTCCQKGPWPLQWWRLPADFVSLPQNKKLQLNQKNGCHKIWLCILFLCLHVKIPSPCCRWTFGTVWWRWSPWETGSEESQIPSVSNLHWVFKTILMSWYLMCESPPKLQV